MFNKNSKTNAGYSRSTLSGLILAIGLITCASINIFAQTVTSPQNKNSDNKADQNLRGSSRVNPSTLAMELNIPLMNYPGRAGNSISLGFTYSSKVWRMDDLMTHAYQLPYSTTFQYVTQLIPEYGSRSIGGWTSTISPPIIEERTDIYSVNGKPIGSEFDELITPSLVNSLMQNYLDLTQVIITNPGYDCGFFCSYVWLYADGSTSCARWDYNAYCDIYNGGGGHGTLVGFEGPAPARLSYYIKRLYLRTSDGVTHEFRKSDGRYGYCYATGHPNNGPGCSGLNADNLGTFLSVDGSGLRLQRETTGSTLYLPDGSKYKFPAEGQHMGEEARLFFATEFQDGDGNTTTFGERAEGGRIFLSRSDTMEREIVDPLPQNIGTRFGLEVKEQDFSLPGMAGNTQNYKLVWKRLKPHGCEAETTPTCGGGEGALEDQREKLYYDTDKICLGASETQIPGTNEFLFPVDGWGLRSCSSYYFEEDPNGNPIQSADRFNPVVLSGIDLPNGTKYVFKYNQYGEISKIIYPTGSFETFQYGVIMPLSKFVDGAYNQTNRGVTEHKIYRAGSTTPDRTWRYEVDPSGDRYKITTYGSKADNAEQLVKRSERDLIKGIAYGERFGFDNPLAGMAAEERSFDDNGVLRARTLTEYKVTGPVSTGEQYYPARPEAQRDGRPLKSISILIEGNDALATLSENVYQDPATDGAPADPSYFAALNVKEKRSHHYRNIPLATAQSGNFSTLAAYFDNSSLASVSQTDYSYDSSYKDRGIIGLPVETRVLNPANPSDVLSKSQVLYDQTSYPIINAGTSPTWQDPGSNLRGNPTTTRTWVKENNTWLETHAQFDNFGNLRKAWDASGDPDKFVETEFSSEYNYAYPTKVISPAPDPNNTHGTSETSSVETAYDYTTGLVLTVTDDFGQITRTEYNDPLLRPTRVFGENFTAPISETIYDDTALTVRVRKQLDENNWDEATTHMDSFGRVVKTVAKDSEGDVTVETHYDLLGRVDRVTNPYRAGDTVYWNKTRYDEAGRAVESYAPAKLADINANNNLVSLGITSFGISTVSNYVGTVVTTTDASGRKGRSITNALGQLIRVDEPTATGGTETADLGSLASPAQPTLYTYDPYGNMVKVTQGAQNRYFKYNSLGRLIRASQPEQETNATLDLAEGYNISGQWTAAFEYDNLGNVVTATDAKGVTIANTYDRAGRVTTRAYYNDPATTPVVNFFYDGKGLDADQEPNYAKGKLTKVYSDVSQTRYTLFDNFGRLKEMEQRTPDGTEAPYAATPRISKYTYNLSGALVEEEYPSGRVVKNEFESDGDIKRIYGKATALAAEQTYANSFAYTPEGKIEKLRLGNGLWESAKFNERLQVTELALGHSVNEGGLWKLNYEYGELNIDGSVNTAKNTGNIAKQTVNFIGLPHPFIQTYKYDSLQRLIEAKETKNGSQTWKQTFGYDRYGNRNTFTQVVGTQNLTINNLTLPTVDTNTNRFSSGQGYAYDKNGNITADPASNGRQFVFNGDSKQTEVKDLNGNPIGRYYYDGEGRRVKKVTDFETTIFVYSGGKLVAEYSTATPPTNPTINYTATDQLGSPRVLTDKYGAVVSRRDFLPFGEELYADGSQRTTANKYSLSGEDAVRKRFTGYEKDKETGLDFAEARYYNNQHGRFTAVDPLIASGRSSAPQTFNRYIYCVNSPFAFTDPSGLQIGWAMGNRFTNNPSGRWHMPVTGDGEPDSSRDYKYIKNGDPADGYREVTERNNLGQLIGPGKGLDGEHVIRFNPLGPRGYPDRTQVLGDIIFGPIGGTPYYQYGWTIIRTDEARAAYMITGAVENVIEPYEIAAVLSPAKLSFSTKLLTSAETKIVTEEAKHAAYTGLDKGGVIRYVGQTGRVPEVRFAEHLRSIGTGKELLRYQVIPGATNLTGTQARVLEQTVINQCQLGKNGGILLNKINSISPKFWESFGIEP